MSLVDGVYKCDKCGMNVGNGGVTESIIVSSINPETGTVQVYHFCWNANPEEACCAHEILSDENLTYYRGETNG